MSGTTLHAVSSPRGSIVHATSLELAGRTSCGRMHTGWVVATLDIVDCDHCLNAIARVRAIRRAAKRREARAR